MKRRFFTFTWQTPSELLKHAFDPADWIAVLLKPHRDGGGSIQRIGPTALITSPNFLAWLRHANAGGYSIYVSINALTPGQWSRRREVVRTVRHVFLDVDSDAGNVLHEILHRRELPAPFCVLHTSADRAQVLWRVSGFTPETAERLQKHLARELGGDAAATSAAQMARLPGFYNHKHDPPPCVDVDYGDTTRIYTPGHFPSVPDVPPRTPAARHGGHRPSDRVERARRYVASVPPAIEGAHGDRHTFRVCCRLVRGFGLTDTDALRLLTEWNVRCQPPWSERELQAKLRHARRYGREPFDGLLEATYESPHIH